MLYFSQICNTQIILWYNQCAKKISKICLTNISKIYLSIRPFRLSLDKYRYDITTPIIPASASTKSGVLSIGTKTSYTKLMKTIMIEIILMIFIFPPEINTVNPVNIESINDKEKLVTWISIISGKIVKLGLIVLIHLQITKNRHTTHMLRYSIK